MFGNCRFSICIGLTVVSLVSGIVSVKTLVECIFVSSNVTALSEFYRVVFVFSAFTAHTPVHSVIVTAARAVLPG
jgi:hypothetical protein